MRVVAVHHVHNSRVLALGLVELGESYSNVLDYRDRLPVEQL